MNLNNLKKWDKVVLLDGKVYIIQKLVGGHKVIFSNGQDFDFWVDGDKVKEIIPFKEEKKEIKIDLSELEDAIKGKENKKNTKGLATTYEELRKLLTHGEKYLEFYHLTAMQNALEIVNNECFYSRETGSGYIKYNNVMRIETTNSVMASNKSERIEKYAKFYLNILNKTTYAMKKHFEKDGTYGVILAVDFSIIKNLKTPIILSPINAHYLTDSDFDWKKYNINQEKNLANLDLSKFDFKKTYSACDFDNENPYLAAEVLFYDKVPLSYISHIFFKSDEQMHNFLGKLPYNKRSLVENKCIVNKNIFW